jgi:putative endonuclease
VKTAKTSRYGDPVTWVTEEKSNRIAKAAEEYIACNDIGGCRLRFDVLALKEQFGEYEVNHIENAFSIDDSFFEEENGR